jgi:hypothetical protein
MTSAPTLPIGPLLEEGSRLPLTRPFTLREALGAGFTAHQLRRLQEKAYIRRVLKGVYAVAQLPDSLPMRAQALRLAVPADVVVTDWTACWLHTGLLAPGQNRVVPPISAFRPAGHDRLRNSLTRSGERTFIPRDLMMIAGLRVTTPVRTALDLGRLFYRDSAIGGMDALMRHEGFSLDQLLTEVDRFKGMRGVVQLRQLAPMVDGRSESPGESTLRLHWMDLTSLPPPEPQVPILFDGGEIYRLDLAVPELRYACEYDGERFHGEDRRDHDAARREELSTRFGWEIDVVRRENIWGPHADVERILKEGIRRARVALGRPTYVG